MWLLRKEREGRKVDIYRKYICIGTTTVGLVFYSSPMIGLSWSDPSLFEARRIEWKELYELTEEREGREREINLERRVRDGDNTSLFILSLSIAVLFTDSQLALFSWRDKRLTLEIKAGEIDTNRERERRRKGNGMKCGKTKKKTMNRKVVDRFLTLLFPSLSL